MTCTADRLHSFYAFSSSATKRRGKWIVLVTTPLPAVLVMTLLEALPLQPPARGLAHSSMTWLHLWICGVLVGVSVLAKLSRLVAVAHVGWRAACVIIGVSNTCAVLSLVLLALWIGYPLPFTFNMSQPVYTPIFLSLTIRAVGWRRLASQGPLLWALIAILLVQVAQTAVYPIFQFLCAGLAPRHQPLFALLLPALKHGFKALYARALRGTPDVKPAVVVLCVEVFHALFISLGVQTSQSAWTLALVIAVDVATTVLSLLRIRRRVHGLAALMDAAGHSLRPLECALHLLSDRATREAVAVRESPRPPHSVAPSSLSVAPTKSPAPELVSEAHRRRLDALPMPERVAFVAQTLDLLHTTEQFMLTEYVKVVVPVVYSIYLSAASQMPNRIFYPQLKILDSSRIRTHDALGAGLRGARAAHNPAD